MTAEAESASDIVVIGGGAAGMTAASRARRLRPDWRITVFERGDYVSFILCGLPYYVDDVIASHESLIVYTPEFFQKEHRIEVHTGHEIRRIDHEQRLLEVTDLRAALPPPASRERRPSTFPLGLSIPQGEASPLEFVSEKARSELTPHSVRLY